MPACLIDTQHCDCIIYRWMLQASDGSGDGTDSGSTSDSIRHAKLKSSLEWLEKIALLRVNNLPKKHLTNVTKFSTLTQNMHIE